MLLRPRQDRILSSGSHPGIQQNESHSTASSIHLETALKALELGLSPGLPTEDGLKRPDGESWKQYQTTPATPGEVITWYRSDRTGNGLFTGYGNLECFEFDDLGIYERFTEAAAEFGLDDLVKRIEAGYSESSPGGGIHWLYTCEKIGGNTKLAERPAPTEEAPHKRQPLVETRGIGGFIVIAPSNGKVHPSGGAYKLLCGGLDTIVTITPDEREALFSLARTFDEIPVEMEPPPRMAESAGAGARATSGVAFPEQGISPGDDFNGRAQLADIIEPFGWVRAHVSGGVEYWRRPGKDRGWSATWGKTKGFRVFTTSTPLETKSHSLLNVYCIYRHGGDWRACVKDLVEQGYGTWIDENGRQQPNPHPKDWRSRARSKARKLMSGKAVDAFVDSAEAGTPGSSGLDVQFRPSGRNGRGNLTVKVDGLPVLVDVININKEADRVRVAGDVAKDRPGIVAEDVAARLFELAGQATESSTSQESTAGADSKYRVIDGCISRATPTLHGEATWIPLCNFGARIVEEVVHDDGVEQSRRLALEGTLSTGEPLRRVEVAIEEFGRGDWPLVRWGSHAIVYAGQGNKDHLRVALQVLSGHPPLRVVRTFTGWCKTGEDWVYLHAGGAIGAVGTVESTHVDLPAALQNYQLPAPPEGEERIAAVRASLDLVRGLAPDEVMLPLLATTYGAVLPGATIATFVAGQTGSGKTQLAALMQQHFGPVMDASRLPANWSSTGNALEALAFAAKDALMVVDDFCPAGSQADVLRYHKEADRLFRAQGNRSGRQRCRTDGSPRPGKAPRGTILSTGEDIPHGHSLRARMMVVELGPDDVKFQGRLSECQEYAGRGLYAQAMASYVRWIAAQYEQINDWRKDEAARLREEINAGAGHRPQHKRTPTAVADLTTGFRLFLRFAKKIGAISPEQAADLSSRCWRALLKTAAEQAGHQEASDPCSRYMDLLRSALSSGRAHILTRDGQRPAESAEAWGWRRRGVVSGAGDDWHPQGKCIGWLDEEDLYLDPDAAYAEANRLAGEQGGSLAVTKDTLHKRLAEQHWLASTDRGRQRRTIRRRLAGGRRDVLHLLSARFLCSGETVPIVPTAPSAEITAENETVAWDGCAKARDNHPTEPSHFSEEIAASGPNGTVGTAPAAYKAGTANNKRPPSTAPSAIRTRGRL